MSKNKTLETIIDILDVDITKDDLQNFKIAFKENFCKLIGDKEELIIFKEMYNIKNPILPCQDSWQLAFDGVVIEKIKNISK